MMSESRRRYSTILLSIAEGIHLGKALCSYELGLWVQTELLLEGGWIEIYGRGTFFLDPRITRETRPLFLSRVPETLSWIWIWNSHRPSRVNTIPSPDELRMHVSVISTLCLCCMARPPDAGRQRGTLMVEEGVRIKYSEGYALFFSLSTLSRDIIIQSHPSVFPQASKAKQAPFADRYSPCSPTKSPHSEHCDPPARPSSLLTLCPISD